MVYMSSDGLDWLPMLESWIKKNGLKPDEIVCLAGLFTDSFAKIYKWATTNLKFVMNVLQVHMLHTMFTLLESLLPCLQDEDVRPSTAAAETKPVIEPETAETAETKEGDQAPEQETLPDAEADTDSEDEEDVKNASDSHKLDFEQIYIFSILFLDILLYRVRL